MAEKNKIIRVNLDIFKDSNVPARPVFETGYKPDSDADTWRRGGDVGGCDPKQGAWLGAYDKLYDGRGKFYSASQKGDEPEASAVAAMGETQHPFAVVVCCSDSRVAPEILFSQSLGDIFVVRIAGNVLDSTALASIEYAVLQLRVQLVIFLGHDDCGAITYAAKQWTDLKPSAPCGYLNSLVQSIIDTTFNPHASNLQNLKADPGKPEYLSEAAMWNSQCQAEYAFNNSSIIRYGPQVMWGHVIMVQKGSGDQARNGQVCACSNGKLFEYTTHFFGWSRPNPMQLNVTGITALGATLNWTKPPVCQEFEIYVKPVSNTDWGLAGTINYGTNSYTIGGLSAGTEYEAKVSSQFGDGAYAESAPIKFKTQ